MKKMDIFCISQSATSICLSMNETPSSTPSSSSSATLLLAAAAIDRHNPIIRDSRRVTPQAQKTHHKKKDKKIPLKENDEKIKESSSSNNNSNNNGVVRKIWKCTNISSGDFISPPGSTRYLLRDNKVVVNDISSSDFDAVGNVVHEENGCNEDVKKTEELFDEKQSSPLNSSDQVVVVVLKVSLHCRGCEKKLRKHLSRMEGLKSFDIDFAAKKVTVSGNVTPLGVLTSISKVKNAQLWSPSISSSTTPQTVINLMSNSEIENDCKEAGA